MPPVMQDARTSCAPAVVIVDPLDEPAITELRDFCDVVVRIRPDEEELRALVAGADVLVMRSGVRLTREVIESAPSLHLVVRAGSGIENIDLDTARSHDVVVCNVPGRSAVSVAELALGLTLAVARRITIADSQVRAGHWRKAALIGTELEGRSLGVLGLGRIGSRIAALGKGFGMRVLASARNVTETRRTALFSAGVELVDLPALVERSDVLCVAVPLTPDTRGLIGRAEMRTLGPEAYLVNVSRAGVVDENALYDALFERRLAGAGLDVLLDEGRSTRFAHLENVVLTPHIGAMTAGAQQAVGRSVVEAIRAELDGRPVANRVC